MSGRGVRIELFADQPMTDQLQPKDQSQPVGNVEPIEPEQARQLLDQAIRERLGDHWDDEETGWVRVTGHDYMARLTRGRKNLDFYVDLLGNVTVEEKELSPVQQQGRLVAWMILLGSLLIAYVVARLTGSI
jgi:hypothetical protein